MGGEGLSGEGPRDVGRAWRAADEGVTTHLASCALAEAAQARAAGAWEQVLHHAERAAAAGADHAVVTELRALALTRLRRLDEAETQFAELLGAATHRP